MRLGDLKGDVEPQAEAAGLAVLPARKRLEKALRRLGRDGLAKIRHREPAVASVGLDLDLR